MVSLLGVMVRWQLCLRGGDVGLWQVCTWRIELWVYICWPEVLGHMYTMHSRHVWRVRRPGCDVCMCMSVCGYMEVCLCMWGIVLCICASGAWCKMCLCSGIKYVCRGIRMCACERGYMGLMYVEWEGICVVCTCTCLCVVIQKCVYMCEVCGRCVRVYALI